MGNVLKDARRVVGREWGLAPRRPRPRMYNFLKIFLIY